MTPQGTTLPRPQRIQQLLQEHAVMVLFCPDEAALAAVQRLSPDELVLGRDPGPSGLAFDDPLASRRHASIHWDPQREQYLLSDHGSRNTTRLDGRPIERELLKPGALIRLGDTVLRFSRLGVDIAGWQAPCEGLMQGRSVALYNTLQQIERVAPTELSVLILGQTGTGKDCVAREIHRLSGRSGALVAINCAAIPETLIESELFGHRQGAFSGATAERGGLLLQAEGGTVLLDEVGELPAAAQAKLLRVLEDKQIRPLGASGAVPIDVRFVFATNRQLDRAVAEGDFRADLFARINQWQIALEPLAARPEDLLPIIESVIAEHGEARSYELSADVFEAFALHRWPFNVRELIAVVRKVLVRLPNGGRIELPHVADDLPSTPMEPPTAERAAKLPPTGCVPTPEELEQLLTHYQGKVAEVARHTGRARNQVYRWLKRYGLDPASFR